ncbi:MAG: hypothetical protein AABY26_00170 [Nanoarchaeota archaeon]
MNKKWFKKGSLNLSIEAIVIVVIAFTVLGLGLGFVKSQIGDISKTSSAVQEQISQQILDDLRTGNKKLSFPATKLTLETGAESVQAIGVKNTEDKQISLMLGFQVREEGGIFQPFFSEKKLTFKSGGQDVESKIIWDDSSQTLKAGETRVLPVTITAPDKSGNYLYKVDLYYVEDGKPSTDAPYDSKTFFIKTS